jgi:lipoyl synthase
MNELDNINTTKKIAGVKQLDAEKTSRIPIKIVPQPMLRKPEWIRMKVPDSARFQEIKACVKGK